MISLKPGRLSEMCKESSEMKKEAILGAIGSVAARVGPKLWQGAKFAARPFGAAKAGSRLAKTRGLANSVWQGGLAFPAAFTGLGAASGSTAGTGITQAAQRGRQIRRATSLYR